MWSIIIDLIGSGGVRYARPPATIYDPVGIVLTVNRLEYHTSYPERITDGSRGSSRSGAPTVRVTIQSIPEGSQNYFAFGNYVFE